MAFRSRIHTLPVPSSGPDGKPPRVDTILPRRFHLLESNATEPVMRFFFAGHPVGRSLDLVFRCLEIRPGIHIRSYRESRLGGPGASIQSNAETPRSGTITRPISGEHTPSVSHAPRRAFQRVQRDGTIRVGYIHRQYRLVVFIVRSLVEEPVDNQVSFFNRHSRNRFAGDGDCRWPSSSCGRRQGSRSGRGCGCGCAFSDGTPMDVPLTRQVALAIIAPPVARVKAASRMAVRVLGFIGCVPFR